MEVARSDQDLSRTPEAIRVSDADIAAIDASVRKEVDDATEVCKAAPNPPLDILTTDVYADGGWAWRN
jgi:pyruvate dehydrogenase E1 component alpha subunit